jgi:hypothetical protein
MSNKPFQPLVVLEKKPISFKYEEVNYKYQDGPTEKKDSDVEEGEVVDKGLVTVPGPGPNEMKILDKRKTSKIDIKRVLARLSDHLDVKDTLNPITPDPFLEAPPPLEKVEAPLPLEKVEVVAPIKTGQKLVIKPKIAAQKPEAIVEEVLPKDAGPEPTEKPKRGRKKKSTEIEPVPEVDLTTAMIRTQKVADRLPKEKEKIIIRAPTYYMSNRKIFTQKLTELFKPYQKELMDTAESVSCESRQGAEFELLTHQKIVRDYLNLYTPYRGLLLYHGLGAGKTASSIAIAEGMKSNKRVFVLTPASLKMNFFSEMKKYGDELYKKNQFWEFISIEGKPEYVGILSRALSLSMEYVRKHKGAWLVNIQKESNYTELETEQQLEVDEQLNEMIRSKYTDIHYNANNLTQITKMLSGDFTRNPFDNSVVVIDEAHNFVSRIVNKIKKPKSISYILYDYLMNASNARIVLLSGTPIINYPNEIGILYNILRGYIKTWTIPAVWEKAEKLNTETILKMLDEGNMKTFDYVDYADNKLTITRNPFGFINTKKRGALAKGKGQSGGGATKKSRSSKSSNKTRSNKEQFIKIPTIVMAGVSEEEDAAIQYDKNLQNPYLGGSGGPVFDRYNGVQMDETGNVSDDDFINRVQSILKSAKNGLTIRGSIELKKYKALPDDAEAFMNMFVNEGVVTSSAMNVFKRRILGLTSYFRSAQEQLLPSFVTTSAGDIYHVVKSPMTPHQFGIYVKIRRIEADQEKRSKTAKRKPAKPGEEDAFNISSTYRIFSRACCNFAFPTSIERPVPSLKEGEEVNEALLDVVPKEQLLEIDEYAAQEEQDEIAAEEAEPEFQKYEKRIEKAMEDLSKKVDGSEASEYLSKDALPMYSPKFATILENLLDETNQGLHLLYSNFRTIEGIAIMRLILLANGFAEFKIKKTGEIWDIVESEADAAKPKFALYTGTEGAEEKEIIRNVYNGMWDYVPATIATKLKQKAENNNYGEVIKILMITSSGAEGINLRNTRFVHIVEPYWHMVRIDQVVGRARRICSHQDLPPELRTVKVFLYISTFSEEQKTDEANIELRIRDVSRLDKNTPVTTDETLYEMASVKQRINNEILKAVKESAIDCKIYSTISKNSENLICYGVDVVKSNQFSSYPSLDDDQAQKEGLDVRKLEWRANKITINGTDYAQRENSNEIYDFNSYQQATQGTTQPILIGRLVDVQGKKKLMNA